MTYSSPDPYFTTPRWRFFSDVSDELNVAKCPSRSEMHTWRRRKIKARITTLNSRLARIRDQLQRGDMESWEKNIFPYAVESIPKEIEKAKQALEHVPKPWWVEAFQSPGWGFSAINALGLLINIALALYNLTTRAAGGGP